ncbi:MAG: hypothetical protein DWQ07_23800 [Chloroflexi bacterium]|nr:MAG: hypothetical protein DWQ07_23800 [Chloroflexota bacterium]MBL1194172.1 hypothetical protein [Chloroflexota bacterium]NOH11464.1 hypothetical protein [Chloroflexota bacterium]
MKNRFLTLITILALLSLLLVACGTPVAEPVVEEPVVEEPVVEEPVVEEPVVEEPMVEFAEEDMDAAFSTFLADMEAYNTIGLEALNTQLAESPPFLLDVRNASEVEANGHIEGSVLIPLPELADNLAYLPSFDTPIVSYCGSGWRCTIALTMLEGLGWEDVKGLKGGSYGGWVDAGYGVVEGAEPEAEMLNGASPNEAFVSIIDEALSTTMPENYGVLTAEGLTSAIAENADLIVIDARRPEELEANGTIEAANWTHIPLETFIDMKDEWPADLDAPIAVYCAGGHRSTIAMSILWAYGYTDVSSLKGGFGGWVADGYPVIGGAYDLDTAFSTFIADMEGYNTMSLDALNTMLIEEPPFLLDVRNASELEDSGHIEGSVLIPLPELADNLAYLPSFDTPIVTYCGSGWRCTIALTLLEGAGWEDVRGLKGGSYGGWVDAGYPVVAGIEPEAEMLNAAEVDPRYVEIMAQALEVMPEPYGIVTADALNTELVENPDLILIDGRRLEELEDKGIVATEGEWQHIPLESFIDMIDEWPADKDATIVVYCGSGHRSTIAAAIMWAYGYTDVRSLKGGFSGWADAGYATAEYVAE